MATLDAKGRSLGSYCQGNWCRWNAQTEKKESAWFWPLNWKSEWQTLTLWLYSLIKVSLFWPYYGSLKGFQSKPCRLAAAKYADAFDWRGCTCIIRWALFISEKKLVDEKEKQFTVYKLHRIIKKPLKCPKTVDFNGKFFPGIPDLFAGKWKPKIPNFPGIPGCEH